MFFFHRKRTKKQLKNKTTAVTAGASQPWILSHVDKPPAKTETFVVSKTIPAVTYGTQYVTTIYPSETYCYVTPERKVTQPVGNIVKVHTTAPGYQDRNLQQKTSVTGNSSFLPSEAQHTTLPYSQHNNFPRFAEAAGPLASFNPSSSHPRFFTQMSQQTGLKAKLYTQANPIST